MMTTNVLKKIEVGNPLGYFGLLDEAEEYSRIESDEEHANFLHRMLDETEERPMVRQSVWAMVAFATGANINADALIPQNHEDMTMDIKLLNGKWTANGKIYEELDPSERKFMDEFFRNFKIDKRNRID